jgi:glycosyltransferase involved in cell wall biosynthesis
VSLVLRLDRPLPSSLPVGSATIVFLIGVCFDTDDAVASLELIADGLRTPATAVAMPRPDVTDAPLRSGFWAIVPVAARQQPGTITLRATARLRSGVQQTVDVGEIEVLAPSQPVRLAARPERPGPGMIAICMATFEPDIALFEAQIESLRAQTDDRWVCVISDDCSTADRFRQIQAVLGDDQRFAISRSERRLGFYRNFERALGMVGAEAELVALSDQDDRWHPNKLSTLRAAVGRAVLVYSDQRLVDAQGRMLRGTLWRGRSNNFRNLASMLVANTITGAAALFTRELLEPLLPFPDTPGFQFHDHWLAMVALSCGEVGYVEEPLYDYVQHPGAVFGDVTYGEASPSASATRSQRWRAAYFYGYLARQAQSQTLLLRCETKLIPSKRRALEWFIAAERSPRAFAWLALRPLRALFGRTETLGSEAQLAQGIVWRRLGGRFGDASFPPPQSFSQRRLRRWRARV